MTPWPEQPTDLHLSGSITLAIAGGSGSGKSSLARALLQRLGPDVCTVVEHDAYYRSQDHLSEPARARLNFDHPSALDDEALIADLRELRAGRAIAEPRYDFSSHRRLPSSKQIRARPVIVVVGILLLHSPQSGQCSMRAVSSTHPMSSGIRGASRETRSSVAVRMPVCELSTPLRSDRCTTPLSAPPAVSPRS